MIIEKRLEAIHRNLVASHIDVFERRVEIEGAGDLRFCDLHGALVVAVARLIADSDPAIDVVFDSRGGNVDVGSQEVAMLEAVVVRAVDRRRAVEKPRDAVVGVVVGLFVKIAQRHSCRSAETERDGWRNPEPAIVRDVASYLAGRAPTPAIQLVQAPVFYGYAFAAYAEFSSPQTPGQLESTFRNLGMKVAAPDENAPSNVSVAGEGEIQIARIEADPSVANGVWMWGAVDNLRLAATNAVQIAEALLEQPAL